MLIASKYHLASKAVADEAHCEVILDWRDANLADHDTCEERQESRQGRDMEISSLVALELVIEILKIAFRYTCAVVQTL